MWTSPISMLSQLSLQLLLQTLPISAVLEASAADTIIVNDTPDHNNDNHNNNGNGNDDRHNKVRPADYHCPNHIDKAQNDFDDYWTTYQEMNEENLADLANFRDRSYDYRQATYTQMKANTFAFKRDYFALHQGDHIYESACGEGLNLFMTLEILKECCNITQLTIHGNDYLAESVEVARHLYRQELQNDKDSNNETPWFRVGNMCQGDSTNLSHVPSNSFDLVYTGFIDPLLDPLNLMDTSASLDEKVEMIEEICEGAVASNPVDNDMEDDDFDEDDDYEQEQNNANKVVDEELRQLALDMQRVQEDWHAAWVSELVRLAKPGKYVIIEDVGWPACSMITEWGGVDPEWWSAATITRYGWDVDPSSVEILDEPPYTWYGNRYNVRMRKNGGQDGGERNAQEDEKSSVRQDGGDDVKTGNEDKSSRSHENSATTDEL